jgi:hypothetical protein
MYLHFHAHKRGVRGRWKSTLHNILIIMEIDSIVLILDNWRQSHELYMKRISRSALVQICLIGAVKQAK